MSRRSLVIGLLLALTVAGLGLAQSSVTFHPNTGGAGITWPISDDTFRVDDGGDGNELIFELSSLTADRTVTWPNSSFTVAGQNISNTFSAHQAFSAGNRLDFASSSGGSFRFSTENTPDAPQILTGATANYWLFQEVADASADCAHALQANPTLFIHSATICSTSTTEYAAYTHLGPAPNRVTVTVDTATTFAITTGHVVLACTGAETINTITGGIAGMQLLIENTDTECTIADDDDATASNAIDLTGTATNDVGAIGKIIVLVYNGTHWLQVSESDN